MADHTSKSTAEHRHQASVMGPMVVGLITASDTRTPETDLTAGYLRENLQKRDHEVVAYELVPDDPERVRAAFEQMLDGPPKLIILNGGTGISQRDNTYDVVAGMLDKTMPGFGELFRMLSYQEIGAAAMLSRAIAGVCRGKLVFSLPGSPAAVRLAWEKLLGPELAHSYWEICR